MAKENESVGGYRLHNPMTGKTVSNELIEGMERGEIQESEQVEFDAKKSEILSRLRNPEDKEFFEKHCNNNGESFRKCLKKMTKKAANIFSKLSGKQCKQFDKLLDNIVSDRHMHTHASHNSVGRLSTEELDNIAYCYKSFFRARVLSELGVNDKLIRSRFLYDRKFVYSYKLLFTQKIEEEQSVVGEFDELMWGFD